MPTDTLADYFDSDRAVVALLGSAMIVTASNMFGKETPIFASTVAGTQRLAAFLYGMGWLVIAVSMNMMSMGGRPMLLRSWIGFKSILTVASVVAITVGTIMAQAEHEALQDGTPISQMPQTLLLVGWAGFAFSLAIQPSVLGDRVVGPLNIQFYNSTKVLLCLVGVLTALAGVMVTRSFELQDAISFVGGDYAATQAAARSWPKWIYLLGWGVISAGIASY